MKYYIGTKIVGATPMTKNDFQQNVKGNPVKEGTTDEEGYRVLYEDDYVSWSPKDVFERCYREITEAEMSLINTL